MILKMNVIKARDVSKMFKDGDRSPFPLELAKPANSVVLLGV